MALHSLLYSLLFIVFALNCHAHERKVFMVFLVHVVYMGDRPQGDFPLASTHHSMLQNVIGRLLTTTNYLKFDVALKAGF
ncbi:hypothetical protein Pint_16026 [Pistacia integerrima]|uniref:Uncharacterized protein n=1 Tax=Pistacia integerrima TaxID=434235 RepID=A0ACC0ZCG2_9ROSI|nr:hypothetical protein Pint_16026 [Pistacia integerrima]